MLRCPADTPVLFGPDQFLGAHVRRVLQRDNIQVWGGECHVHAGINGSQLAATAEADPTADLYIHPECGCATSALYLATAGAVAATVLYKHATIINLNDRIHISFT